MRRCRLCGSEASRVQDGEGHAYHCGSCGRYWIGPLLVREVLGPHAERLCAAVRILNESGEPRVELRGADDIARVLADAEALEVVSR